VVAVVSVWPSTPLRLAWPCITSPVVRAATFCADVRLTATHPSRYCSVDVNTSGGALAVLKYKCQLCLGARSHRAIERHLCVQSLTDVRSVPESGLADIGGRLKSAKFGSARDRMQTIDLCCYPQVVLGWPASNCIPLGQLRYSF